MHLFFDVHAKPSIICHRHKYCTYLLVEISYQCFQPVFQSPSWSFVSEAISTVYSLFPLPIKRDADFRVCQTADLYNFSQQLRQSKQQKHNGQTFATPFIAWAIWLDERRVLKHSENYRNVMLFIRYYRGCRTMWGYSGGTPIKFYLEGGGMHGFHFPQNVFDFLYKIIEGRVPLHKWFEHLHPRWLDWQRTQNCIFKIFKYSGITYPR
jgi:hypothetical protein